LELQDLITPDLPAALLAEAVADLPAADAEGIKSKAKKSNK